MEKKTKKVYEVPALTVVSFKVERGYAASNLLTAFGLWDGNSSSDAGSPAMDDYSVESNNGGYWNW